MNELTVTLRFSRDSLYSTDSSQGVSSKQLHSETAQIAIVETIVYGAHTVTFQPRPKYPIEDRHSVEDWKLSNGTWKFIYWSI